MNDNKVNIAGIKANIAAMFTMFASTGITLPGAYIRPPARTVPDTKGRS